VSADAERILGTPLSCARDRCAVRCRRGACGDSVAVVSRHEGNCQGEPSLAPSFFQSPPKEVLPADEKEESNQSDHPRR
jgi:hypothetical protein